MKKAADYIAVSAFFVIVIMFAAYTLVMGRHGLSLIHISEPTRH